MSEGLTARAAALAQSLDSGDRDAAKAAFRDLGAVCRRHHEDFRDRKK